MLEYLQKDLYIDQMNESSKTPSPLAALCKKHRLERKLTQSKVAELVRDRLPDGETFTQQTYAAFEKGETRQTRYALQLIDALGITIAERAEMMQNEVLKDSPKTEAVVIGGLDVWDNKTPLNDDEVEVPLLKDVELSAGNGRYAEDQRTTTTLRFNKLTLRRQGIEPADVVCIAVSGNSMEPVLPHGSTVGVDQGKTGIKDGDIYAISHNEHLRVKLVYRLPGGAGIRLRSFNRDDHPDEEYSNEKIDSENILILGRVFWYSVMR
ncbi:XRE family transcriptional regulator [Pseudomonas sp. LJDD11]|uniref:LexA family transcriptional regulator n=1 Tax=Pseudomonas sp. LJDD11 TaxID=2931984 RepID=UPI00211C198B|nr:S24 family peptidase [Pseudomonas sp. LJDD11]MCQ9422702.1 XRE family transcriptional regulator [Pseudomonas sp. LJDD11]